MFSEIVNTSATAPAPAADDKEDEYKRKLEEKKREHQRRKQEQEQLEQERLNQLEQQEHDKKKQREAELDAKFEVVWDFRVHRRILIEHIYHNLWFIS